MFSTNAIVNRSSEDIWRYEICQTFLNVVEFAELRVINKTINGYWRVFIPKFMRKAVIRVEKDIPRLSQALALANAYWVPYYDNKGDTVSLKIELGWGIHSLCERPDGVRGVFVPEIGEGTHGHCRYTEIERSHITIVGRGFTTIEGAFYVSNQQNIKFEAVTFTNENGNGLCIVGPATTVDVLDCVFEDCLFNGIQASAGPIVTVTGCEFMENGRCGMHMYNGAIVIVTECEFMDNRNQGVSCVGANTNAILTDCTMSNNNWDGLCASDDAVVDIHGTKTDMYENMVGIRAYDNAKVNIHLPSQHNTTHENDMGEQVVENGGSIAYINVDGTFTHVEEADFDDDEV